MEQKREPGYYWVTNTKGSNPEVGYWTGANWQVIGDVKNYGDFDFYKIGRACFPKIPPFKLSGNPALH